jgi:hypothetical protein
MPDSSQRQLETDSHAENPEQEAEQDRWSEISQECLSTSNTPAINPEVSTAEASQLWYVGLPTESIKLKDGSFASQPQLRQALEPFMRAGILPPEFVINLDSAETTLETIKEQINQNQHDASQTLVDVVHGHKITMYGEGHLPENPHRKLLIETLPKLKEAGATHLAIELEQEYQPLLDEFMETGKIDVKKLPGKWGKEETLSMLNAARNAGLTLVAADMATEDKYITDDNNQKTLNPERDKHIAQTISSIVDADPDNKIIYFGGARHNATGIVPEGEPERAGSILKERYPGSVSTIAGEIGGTAKLLGYVISDRNAQGQIDQSSAGTRDPIAIRLSETPAIAESHLWEPYTTPDDTRALKYKDYSDIIFLYPGRYVPPGLDISK